MEIRPTHRSKKDHIVFCIKWCDDDTISIKRASKLDVMSLYTLKGRARAIRYITYDVSFTTVARIKWYKEIPYQNKVVHTRQPILYIWK